ncbi:Uncharacterised protein [Salmonella enterica subsp. arizonae]|uniref:Uncharacterized protein n=1 Tax=Salmonella enterica subsp. arizonae TaxID=59203 RepID=A0A379SHY6_SALER|nr:Uncharacterised protein [Salmonella enterica subsp. arizonae]
MLVIIRAVAEDALHAKEIICLLLMEMPAVLLVIF